MKAAMHAICSLDITEKITELKPERKPEMKLTPDTKEIHASCRHTNTQDESRTETGN